MVEDSPHWTSPRTRKFASIAGMHSSNLFGEENESELMHRGKQACRFLAIGEGDFSRISTAIERSGAVKNRQDNVEIGFAMGLAAQTICAEWNDNVAAWALPTTPRDDAESPRVASRSQQPAGSAPVNSPSEIVSMPPTKTCAMPSAGEYKRSSPPGRSGRDNESARTSATRFEEHEVGNHAFRETAPVGEAEHSCRHLRHLVNEGLQRQTRLAGSRARRSLPSGTRRWPSRRRARPASDPPSITRGSPISERRVAASCPSSS